MKKSYPFNEMGDRRCVVCGRPIKRRLVEEKPTATKCFQCFRAEQEARGNSMSTAREVRTGQRPHRKPRIPKEDR